MSDDGPVVVRVDGGVATLELNRAEKRNALNEAAINAFLAALDEVRGRAKVVVVTGRGTAFCSGIDLKERLALDEAAGGGAGQPRGAMATWIRIQDQIRHHPAIFIAAVNGYALGGGVTLINSCDLALAADEASIGMPELGFGMYPAMSGASTQMRLLPKHAAWLVLTTDRIDGPTAAKIGLVNRSVPLRDLAEEASKLAERIAAFDAVTLEWTKKALWDIPMKVTDYTQALEYGDLIALQIRTSTASVAEGLRRFSEGKRNPGQGA